MRGGRIDRLASSLFLAAEQGVGGIAMRGGLRPVSPDPGDLGLEQGDPRRQLVLRIGGEVLGGQFARSIASGARTIVFIHGGAIFPRRRLAVNCALR